jgi:hypothetical protein
VSKGRRFGRARLQGWQIALVATRAVPANAHLPWLIYNASGSAQLAFHGSKIALRPAATWWSSGHP